MKGEVEARLSARNMMAGVRANVVNQRDKPRICCYRTPSLMEVDSHAYTW